MRPTEESYRCLKGKEKELGALMYQIFPDYEFIGGTLADLKCDAEREMVIRFIKTNPGISAEEVILFAFEVSQTRER